MQDYDYARLLGRMRQQGYTQETLAKGIGISACSLNLTLKNKRSFRQDEMLRAGELLAIPVDEFPQYFFSHKL